jgi:cytochrome c556
MNLHSFSLIAALIGLGTLAVAHTGVQNPAVLARMESMKATQDSTKVLGDMAKGARGFDAALARAAAAEIARHASETPDLFSARETDPMTEALPVIWENFEDFTRKSQELESVASALAMSLETEADLREGLMRIGAGCKSCHERYRK